MFAPIVLVLLLVLLGSAEIFGSRRLNDDWNKPTVITRSDEDLFPVSIIHWNDFHARFEETNEQSTTCQPGQKCIGGYARLVAGVKQLQRDRSATNPIYLNAGDNFQGTLWYNIGRWNVTQQFLNMLPADAITLGNHEFDHQVSGVVPFMKAITSPFVVANLDDSLEPTIQGLYTKSIVIERYQRKIGIVGVMLATTDTIADTGKLKFLDESVTVRAEAAALRARGIDIIIVLSHCGLDVDKIIARDAGPDIDVIVGGHSHTFMYTGDDYPGPSRPSDKYPAIVQQPPAADGSVHEVLIVQASAYTRYLGDLTVWFDAAGRVVRWGGQPIYLDERVEPDAEVTAALQPWKVQIDEAGTRIVGESRVPLLKSGCNVAECNLGSFIADAYTHAWAGRDEHWSFAPVALVPVGGIRTTLGRGVLTFADIVASTPFENTVDVVELTGEHLLETLEYAVAKSWDEDRFNGQHVVQVSGLRLVANVTRPVGDRVVSVDVLCRKCTVPRYVPLDKEEVYNVVVGSYLATGGDGFAVVKDKGRNRQIGPVDIDALSAYVERMSPIFIGRDNRLTIVQ